MDREGLWYKVLVARYGEVDGQLCAGGRRDSYWWREVAKIRDGGEGFGGGWFRGSVVKKVGDGRNTLFWLDPWVGGVPLSVRFRRLFDLSVNKSISVSDMSLLGWDDGGEAWKWRRRLWDWEEELVVECRTLLSNVLLQAHSLDQWLWQPDPDGGYSVRGAYQLLTVTDNNNFGAEIALVWHKQVPTKVSIFAWRLLRDRLPTKDNLVSRGILSEEQRLCSNGCGELESASHLFLYCPHFAALWPLLRSWIGVSTAEPNCLSAHFIQFTFAAGSSRAKRSLLQLIWLATVWVLWSERNNRLFNNQEKSIDQLFDSVKSHTLWWLKAAKAPFVFGYQCWWSSPLVCLGIG